MKPPFGGFRLTAVVPKCRMDYMKLLYDDFNQVYIWVEEYDENIELSPHFDYEDDAIQWRDRVKKLTQDKK